MPAFQVQLDAYHGPLDLLLYLVKKEELPIAELPLATLTGQYLEFVEVLERLEPDAVGEFLDVASLLLMIKSGAVLPAAEDANDGDAVDEAALESPGDLVQRLLEFKHYRDAAAELETLRLDWSKRYTRAATAGPAPSDPTAGDKPVEGVELWDLVSAFARVMRRRLAPEPERTIYYDETPVQQHLERVREQLSAAHGPVAFDDLFPADTVHRSTLVGVFLAVLELVRYHGVRCLQPERYGPIWLEAAAAAPVSSAG